MQFKSLKDALASAEAAAPATGGVGSNGGAWPANKSTPLEIVAANYKEPTKDFPVPSVGVHLQNEDGRRRWFDIRFPENDETNLARTGRKLKALGMSDVLDLLDEQYPEDGEAQLTGIATALVGVKFIGKIDKVEFNTNPANAIEPEDVGKPGNDGKTVKKYRNFFDVVQLLEGPASVTAVTPDTGLSGGLGGLLG